MNAKEILTKWLKDNDYIGFSEGDHCSCDISDIQRCADDGFGINSCAAIKKLTDKEKNIKEIREIAHQLHDLHSGKERG